jgi:glycosyltransferase involved in cell wall biosynthesis
MNICFYNVTASFIQGGLETYCWEAGRALARRGHSVTIVAGNRGQARNAEVKLVQFPFRAEPDWPDFGTRFRRLAERLSFARHSLSHLVAAGYDAVIVNKPFDFPILWRARRAGLKARTLFRSGGRDFYLGDQLFAGAVQHWVSSSRYNADQVCRRYGRAVTVIHNGVDVELFRPLATGSVQDTVRRDAAWQHEYGVAQDDVVLASVGRLVGWKGLRVIVDAMTQLPPHYRYLVVGSGPEEVPLRQLAKERGLEGRVRVVGRVDHAKLPDFLARCDLLVQPSIGEEAFGISVVEAMACGLPVFASNNGGLPEIVVDGETGRLLPPGDVAAWTTALRATGIAQLRAMGLAARERAASGFTWARNAARLEDMLTLPLSNGAHGGPG